MLKNRFWEFPTSFSYGFCLCFVKIPCLAPIGLYHKNLTITYRPSFSLPSKHFSTYVLEGFGRFFNDPLKNQSWNLENEQNRRPHICDLCWKWSLNTTFTTKTQTKRSGMEIDRKTTRILDIIILHKFWTKQKYRNMIFFRIYFPPPQKKALAASRTTAWKVLSSITANTG